MGQYDEQIANATKRLTETEAEYTSASLSMADAAPHVRDFVLSEIQRRIDESKWMIQTFTEANE
ncbi:MAG: hypothetical protein J0J05_16395 [Microbacterium sp.]|jgi:hypothetical protein|uniref:hypothetical protein n=1 Tax=Microbacterium sp. TaxID=51671 RepID=UPI001AD39E9B|nr:hypothetical protein [Microbacterium sp.]MBN9155562.1 hypothetical protein [Microbacterium sp.]